MQISSVSLSPGDCFPDSPGFIYIRVTSTRILPTQLITANIVSVVTFLFAGESPERLCLFLVADVESHRERCQPQPRLHSLSSACTALPGQAGNRNFSQSHLTLGAGAAPGCGSWSRHGQVPGLFLEQRHKHVAVMWWQSSLRAPSSSNPRLHFRLIQHSWGQTTESVEKKGYYPCSCTERMLNSQQRVFFQSNS